MTTTQRTWAFFPLTFIRPGGNGSSWSRSVSMHSGRVFMNSPVFGFDIYTHYTGHGFDMDNSRAAVMHYTWVILIFPLTSDAFYLLARML